MFSMKTDTFTQVSICRLPLQLKRRRKLLEKIAEKATHPQHFHLLRFYCLFQFIFHHKMCSILCIFCSSVYCRQGGPCVVGRIFALVLLHIHHLKMWEKAQHTVAVGGFENVGILVVLGRVQRPDSTSVGCFEALERRHVYLMACTNTPLTTYISTQSHYIFIFSGFMVHLIVVIEKTCLL